MAMNYKKLTRAKRRWGLCRLPEEMRNRTKEEWKHAKRMAYKYSDDTNSEKFKHWAAIETKKWMEYRARRKHR